MMEPASDSVRAWYKEAVIYQVHVRAFHDSNNDGIGDFRGLTSKLDYLADLGVTAIWVLPFYPSPLKDDGYDIADYKSIHKYYGTIEDFKEFLRQAHLRGLKVITELVINHTSDQHEWFQKSRRAKPGEPYHDYYVWSDDPNKYKEARIIFKDFETSNWAWDPVAKKYFWHRFYSHQPDLNFDNPEVRQRVFEVMDYWLEMGVDGMRLDAIPYLFEREGTSCENLPETHEFLKELRAQMDAKYTDRIFLAEANQWPEDAIAYFGDGDECHMAFHFPLMPRLFMALRMEDHFTITDILKQTPPIPEPCQWATFLRNHDELTLEMVTDEERDYMYNMYASDPRARINLGIRRRLAPLLGNDRRQIQLLNALLFALPGTPVVYYGDEIGMGDNIYLGDRDGVRTPFQWNPDRNAGFSKSSPQQLFLPVTIEPEYHYETVNVEIQQKNSNSHLWWMKNLIALKRRHPALNYGSIQLLEGGNSKIFSFIRECEDQAILCVANLSRTAQCVELDLSSYKGGKPVELFGSSEFPPIGELPYFLTLAPYSFYWFELYSRDRSEAQADSEGRLPILVRLEQMSFNELDRRGVRDRVESGIASFLIHQRWFAGKSRKIGYCEIEEFLPLGEQAGANPEMESRFAVCFVRVHYTEGLSEKYFLPMALMTSEQGRDLLEKAPGAVICRWKLRDSTGETDDGIIADAHMAPSFGKILLKIILDGQRLQIGPLALSGTVYSSFPEEWRESPPEPHFRGFNQSNSSVVFGQELILKTFRRMEEGMNTDLEICRFLNKKGYPGAPVVHGSIQAEGEGRYYTLGLTQFYVKNQGEAWDLAVDSLTRMSEQALGLEITPSLLQVGERSVLQRSDESVPEVLQEIMGYYFELSSILGYQTAELHRALGESGGDPFFEPESFTPFYQRSLYQSFRNGLERTILLLKKQKESLNDESRKLVEQVIFSESDLLERFSYLKDRTIEAKRTRHHGDFHLGQVLFLGNDFLILDYEGEPSRTLSERKIKRSPLRDVAGMIRSYDYAIHYSLRHRIIREEDREKALPWLKACNYYLTRAYLQAYLERMSGSGLLPENEKDLTRLLQSFLLEKALYEIRYELNNRPDWVDIPLRGLMSLAEMEWME